MDSGNLQWLAAQVTTDMMASSLHGYVDAACITSSID
jgi:hypothetical protein